MSHYFVPFLVEEFINLLRLGKIKTPPNCWLYHQPEDIHLFYEQLKEIIPTFEDTISIVIVEFKKCLPVTPKNYTSVEFSFEDAIATYALTEHDQYVLKSRLGKIAKLSKNLLIDEKIIENWKFELSEEKSLQGAKSLLKIYQGQNYQFDDDEVQRRSLLQAISLKNNERTSPINNGSYLDNLICYSRSDPTQNDDFGFFCDAGRVLRYFLGEKPRKDVTDPCRIPNPSFAERVNDKEFDKVKSGFDEKAKMPGALVSSLVFLRLSHEIREHNQSLNREWLRNCLGPIHDQASVARGVWWCGGFWGFTQFAEEYYAIASLPEAPESRFPDSAAVPTPVIDQTDSPADDSTTDEPVPDIDATPDKSTPTVDAAATPGAPTGTALVGMPVEPVQETPQVIHETMEPVPESASVAPELTAPTPEISADPEQSVVETLAVSPDETADTASTAEQADTANVPVQTNPDPAAPPANPESTPETVKEDFALEAPDSSPPPAESLNKNKKGKPPKKSK